MRAAWATLAVALAPGGCLRGQPKDVETDPAAPPLFTEPGWSTHTAEEIGIDDFQASRSPDRRFYRTTPLRGLFTRAKGGFYHDGRFESLEAVVEHYARVLKLELSPAERADLVQVLRSL